MTLWSYYINIMHSAGVADGYSMYGCVIFNIGNFGIYMQIPRRVIFVWREVVLSIMDVWKCTTMVNGAQSVMTIGTTSMPMWCAGSSITAEAGLELDKRSLVKVQVPFSMTMWPALGLRHAWLTVPIAALGCTTVVMVKMQECGASLY